MSESTKNADPSLRATKKQQTETEILAKAIAQFRQRGVRGTRLAEVARASHVSPATLFNYFANKGALAEAWMRGEIDAALDRVSGEFADHGLRSVMRTLCRRLASAMSEDRAIRLEAWRESGRAAAMPISGRHPLVRALSREQERERIRRDISSEAIAEMLLEAIEGGVIASLRGSLSEADFAKCLRTRVDLILDGSRKRNERVAAPIATSSAGASRRLVADR